MKKNEVAKKIKKVCITMASIWLLSASLTQASSTIDLNSSNATSSNYYASAQGLSGDALKKALHNIIDDHRVITYSQVTNALKETDEDPNNKNNVLLLYTQRSQAKSTFGPGVDDWNREHVWARSRGNLKSSVANSDLHHLRPTDASVNSNRGNLDFDLGGNKTNPECGCKYDQDSWEPPAKVRGDVARMLFYMAVRYEGDSGDPNLELTESVGNTGKPLHGKLSQLLKWHAEDPVDAFEKRRNELIYSKYQNNRNPFIDHPEWVSKIWK
ncbi:endonuclease I family protein [Paenibacillus sp. 481]|uniref:endonuclease I family protein n=1 Tax=Paenibacillus sp. 481 TaxID=2835869 RepID=UPI001E332907|nr:endonuclease [Paenibacillus sp. 481]UHA72120.1 endonuclease [Paenibacillus sp. 481]